MAEPKGPAASLASLLCALSFATDLNMGQPLEHGLKTVWIGMELAEVLGLPAEDRVAIYYGGLLKDAGFTACAPLVAKRFNVDEIAARRDYLLTDLGSLLDLIMLATRTVAPGASMPVRFAKAVPFFISGRVFMRDYMRTHCEAGEMLARRLGLPAPVQQTVRYLYENWNGKGVAYGLKGESIPMPSRVLHAAQVTEAVCRFGGLAAVTVTARQRRAKEFDPVLADALLALSRRREPWETLSMEAVQQRVRSSRPAAPFDDASESDVDKFCEAIGDFIDIKSATTWGHAELVAAAAVGIGGQMGLSKKALRSLRRAGLVHDLGKVTVPCKTIEKRGNLSADEWERVRLHPYYTERILSRVEELRDLAIDASAHHEWVNGRGYPKQLTGETTSLSGRILAVANAYAMLLSKQGQNQMPDAALAQMRPLAGKQFDPACLDALAAWLHGAPGPSRRASQAQRPANLTEREIEVLRLLAKGLTNRQMAKALVISEKTVEHHLEHIYGKLDVTCRASAVVFAVQNGIAG